MFTVRDGVTWRDGGADGVVRDLRLEHPDDGLLPGAVMHLGDAPHGPAVSMTIERRLFPRKAPVHMHKSDTFRMALGEPIVVGRTEYRHGEFRVQAADSFYGPEVWTDEIGTNQVLVMADRRGVKPYLVDEERQAGVDDALEASDDLFATAEMFERDADVDHRIVNNIGGQLRAGHWDGGFTQTASWPQLGDGSRLGLIELGSPTIGPLLLCWDRPPGSIELPRLRVGADLVRLVVDGAVECSAGAWPRLAFRLQQAGTWMPATRPGRAGAKELWLLADRSQGLGTFEPSNEATRSLAEEVADAVTAGALAGA